jgi:hypothetical protein
MDERFPLPGYTLLHVMALRGPPPEDKDHQFTAWQMLKDEISGSGIWSKFV